ncbi:MAG TPA: 3-hydroxy-3-methylglutaryl-CoA reductase, partial [Promineifilum sp.]|nr:3-hydroxy-3-methylglutaryl-CoA reductase [Promineifilum sp.]
MGNGVAIETKTSRLPGFYRLGLAERVAMVAEWAGLSDDEAAVLAGGGLTPGQADHMIENALGTYALPLGVAVNFLINGRDYLIPMTVEEPSVLAAVCHAAKLIRAGGGFMAEASEPVMIGQIQVLDVGDGSAADMAAAMRAL